DLDAITKRYARVEKQARSGEKELVEELEVLKKIKPALEDGIPVRALKFSEEEEKIVRSLFLLTSKPVLYVANVAEDDMADPTDNEQYQIVKAIEDAEVAEVVGISAGIEEELSTLDDEERDMFLEDLGATEPGLHRLNRRSYELLNLGTYFT